MKAIGRLHILTDFSFQQHFNHAELARRAIQGGADTIQFRQKRGGIRDLIDSARTVMSVCREAGIPLIVNDRVDVALAIGADGVHLGQNDMPLPEARKILGSEALIGLTTPEVSLALTAQDQGADYVGFGPVYQSRSKSNTLKPQGLGALKDLSKLLDIPVIAIGGITVGRCRETIESGAYGIAVMTAVSLVDNPAATTKQFADVIESMSPGI